MAIADSRHHLLLSSASTNWGASLAKLDLIQLGIIVPTKDRPQEMNRLLESIYKQSYLAKTLIVVDGSGESIEAGLLRDPRVELIYVRVLPPSLTVQRNRGVQAIPEGLTHVGFLDDDIVLLDGAVEALVHGLAEDVDTLGGVSFNIIEDAKSTPSWILRLLGLHPMRIGQVSKGGSVAANVNVTATRDTKFLCGGATVWRVDVLRKFKFDEALKGYALWEDVDFSYRVSKHWALRVIESAKVLHLHVPSSQPNAARFLGDLEIVDRFYFCMKHRPEMSRLATTWAAIGTIIRNSLAYLGGNPSALVRVWANVCALLRCTFVKVERRAP